MSNLLPNRPLPGKDESLSGYATRLAAANFWPTPDAMFRDMKLKPFVTTHRSSYNLKNALIQLTSHKQKINSMNFSKKLTVFTNDIDRCFRRVECFTPKICVECIREDGYIKNDTSFHGIEHCLKHEVPYIKECVGCGTKLTWNSDLLSLTCSHCKSPIKQASKVVIPKYLAYIFTLISTEMIKITQDLFLCTQRIIRPLDSIIDIREHAPEFDNWSDILETAYELLTDSTCAERWVNYQSKHRTNLKPIGSNAVFLPLLMLQRKLRHDWPICNMTYENLKADDGYVHKFSNEYPIPKFRLVNKPSDLLLQQQVGTNALKIVLGGHDFTIWKLVEAGIVKPIKEVRVMRSAIFQLDEVVSMVATCYQPTNTDVMTRNQYRNQLPNAVLSDLEILTRISHQKLIGSVAKSGSTTLDMFEIKTTCYEEMYEESIEKLKSMNISSYDVKTILNLDNSELSNLLKTGKLHTEIYKARRIFRGIDIVNFIEQKGSI